MSDGVLFAGGELGSFLPSDSTVIEAPGGPPSNVPVFDPAYARCAMTPGNIGSSADGFAFAAHNDIWVHGNLNYTFSGVEETVLQVKAGATVVWKLTGQNNAGAAQYRMYWWNGAAFVQVGAGFSIPQFTLQTFDIHLSATDIHCYVAGTTKDGAAGAFANVTAMTEVDLLPNLNECFDSEIIVSDQSTFGYRLQTMAPTGNGATQQWNGDFTDIDEIVTNDGMFISTPSPNELELFSHSTVITQSIRAIVVTARAGAAAGSPQNLQLAVKSGATVGLSASIPQGVGFQPNVAVFANDPNTASPWTTVAANALQYGVKSIA